MIHARAALVTVTWLFLAGCPHREPWPVDGDGGSADARTTPPGPPDADVVIAVDARPRPPDASQPSSCEVPRMFGALGDVDGTAEASVPAAGQPADVIVFNGRLDMGPTGDVLSLQLYRGFGVFSGGITTGTFAIAGQELDYATCGLCVLVYSDVVLPSGMPGQVYLATGGEVILTSVEGRLTATLSGIRLEHVTIDATTFESTPVGDGCETSIDSASIDEPILIM